MKNLFLSLILIGFFLVGCRTGIPISSVFIDEDGNEFLQVSLRDLETKFFEIRRCDGELVAITFPRIHFRGPTVSFKGWGGSFSRPQPITPAMFEGDSKGG